MKLITNVVIREQIRTIGGAADGESSRADAGVLAGGDGFERPCHLDFVSLPQAEIGVIGLTFRGRYLESPRLATHISGC